MCTRGAAQWGDAWAAPESLNRRCSGLAISAPFDHSRAAWQRARQSDFAAADAARPVRACFDGISGGSQQLRRGALFQDVRPALEALAARACGLDRLELGRATPTLLAELAWRSTSRVDHLLRSGAA